MIDLFLVSPYFSHSLRNFTAKEGDAASLSCVVEGSPLLTVKWLKKSNSFTKALVSTESGKFSVNATAFWKKINRSDTGYYRCEASNGVGENAFSNWAYLNVQCKLLCQLNYDV